MFLVVLAVIILGCLIGLSLNGEDEDTDYLG